MGRAVVSYVVKGVLKDLVNSFYHIIKFYYGKKGAIGEE